MYRHKEAFCLMYYENEKTKMGFLVWNSRDGVTPFCVFENGFEYHHSHWPLDKVVTNSDYIISRILLPGQRIFRDMTKEEAEAAAIKRLRSARGTIHEVDEGSEDWERLKESLTKEFTGSACMRTVVTAGVMP